MEQKRNYHHYRTLPKAFDRKLEEEDRKTIVPAWFENKTGEWIVPGQINETDNTKYKE